MNVNSILTRDYENKSNPTLGENKPNSNPICQRPENERKHLSYKELRKFAPPPAFGKQTQSSPRRRKQDKAGHTNKNDNRTKQNRCKQCDDDNENGMMGSSCGPVESPVRLLNKEPDNA